MAECSICQKPTSGSLEFCKNCYRTHKDDIKGKKPWTRVIKNEEQRERRRKKREFDNTSLDAIIDRSYTERY